MKKSANGVFGPAVIPINFTRGLSDFLPSRRQSKTVGANHLERFLVSGALFLFRLWNPAQVVPVCSWDKPEFGGWRFAAEADTPLWVDRYGFHSGKLPQTLCLTSRWRPKFPVASVWQMA
ncbi:MAG TPA: hypothetical protein VN829_07530 [Dongiaceae bacterium]|nr:hypothetical protein [Dongiaceae bacterium]